jgi:hypothetical protein
LIILIFLTGYLSEEVLTCLIASTHKLENKALSPEINLEERQVLATFSRP